MKYIYKVSLWLTFLMFLITTANAQNLVTDPGFEAAGTITAPWTNTGTGTAAGETTTPINGTRSQELTIAAAGDRIEQTIGSLLVGKTYKVSVYASYRVETGTTSGLQFYVDGIATNSSSFSGLHVSSNSDYFTFSFVATATSHTIGFGLTNADVGDIFWLDEASVLPSLATNPQFDGTFTGGVAQGWSKSGGISTASSTTVDATGSIYSQSIGQGTVTADYISQTISGLTAGKQYTIKFNGYIVSGTFANFGVEVGIYAPTSASLIYDNEFLYSAATTWEQNTFTFTATETSHQIRFSGGNGIVALIDELEFSGNNAPVLTGPIAITTSTLMVGYSVSMSAGTITGAYSDTESDAEGTHTYQWYRNDNSTGLNKTAISGATASSYTLTASDVAKYITVAVTPVAATGSSPGVSLESSPVGPILNNDAPVAVINTFGPLTTLKEDLDVQVDFNVTDTETDNVGYTVTFYRSSTSSGASKTQVQTATVAPAAGPLTNVQVNYTLQFADVNNYIIVEVTPSAATGATPGAKVSSVTSSVVTGYTYGIVTMGAAPANGDTNIIVQPLLNWNSNANIGVTFDQEDQYELQISTDQFFADIYYAKTDIAATPGASTAHSLDLSSVSVTLKTNTKYYWRIRAKESTKVPVRYSPWSTIWNFTTTKTAAPSLSYPIGGVEVYSVTPTFYWYMGTYSTGLEYKLEISTGTGGAFAGGLVGAAETGITTNYFTTAHTLVPGTTYFWKVYSVQGLVEKASAEGTFVVSSSAAGTATVPTASFPTGGTTVYSLTPTLYWYTVTATTGLTYQVQVATDNAFTNVVWTTNGSTALSATVGTTLSAGTTYYWRVQSYYGLTPSGYTSAESFVTYTPASSGTVVTPTPSWPVGGAEMYSTTVSLHWWLGTYSTGLTYEVDVATDNAFSSIVNSYTGITTLYKEVTGLSSGTTYYWRVRSTNGSSFSSYSSTESFEISATSIGSVVDPILVYPTGGLTVFTTSPSISWLYAGSTAGITFEIRYGSYPNGVSATTTTSTSTSLALTGLTAGATYYWAIRATDGSNFSAWTADGEFVVAPSATSPITPNPGSPVAGVTVNDMSPMLSWFIPSDDKGITYEIQISKDPQFANSIEYKDINLTSKVINDLETGTVYNWRVRTKRADGNYSQFSNSSTFVTPGVTGTDENSGIVPTEFTVAQNYPNPFNPSTTINYSIPESGFVTIKIFNMLGQEVKTLVNGELTAGIYNVKWNGVDNGGSKVSSGTYIYRVEASNHIVTRKMVLLK